jgi:GPH family glycoside/pentoside/hexuronide:cation symporter
MSSEPAIKTLAAEDKIPFKEKLSYALGNFPGGIYSGVMGQINTFYFAWMLLKWEWIVIGQIIYAIWNIVNDPLFGYLQDRTKTKKGRYLPWIKFSSLFFAISFLIVFIPPEALRSKADVAMMSPEQIGLFVYYVIAQIFYDTMYTIIYLAWVALLPQMTMDEGERTKTAALSAITAALGLAVAGLSVVSLIDPTLEKIKTFQISIMILSVISFIPWLFVIRNVKERVEYMPVQDTSFLDGVKCVVKNPAGRIYMLNEGILQGVFFLLTTGLMFAITWLLGQNQEYQALHPDWGMLQVILVVGPGLIGFITGILIMAKITTPKYGIKGTLMFSLIAECVGFFITFLGFLTPMDYTNTPIVSNNLWLAAIGLFIALMGLPGYFIYQNPMRADTIDYDEYLTGERREAVYAGVASIFGKGMQSVGLAAVPAVMGMFGLVATPDSSPIQTTLYWTQGYARALLGVNIATFLLPSILAFIGIFIWRLYPLTKDRVQEIRPILDKMHEEKRQQRLNR